MHATKRPTAIRPELRWRAFAVRALAGALAALLAPAAGADPLLVVYRDKPPYSYVDNGVAKGFLYDRMARILARAGIEARFEVLPPKRIFVELQNNTQPLCTFGWYKLPEREKYARFSAPIHQDRPHVVLAGPRSTEAVSRHKTLQSLMQDASLVLATVDGVSYGPELDALIAAFPGVVDRALVSPLQVAKKLSAKRADFMLIDQDDYDYLSDTSPDFRAEKLVRLSYPDLPAGLKRYILCSQKVDEGAMRRIDAALAATLAADSRR